MRVCLVAMPWQSLESPSLPIGLLRAAVAVTGRATPDSYHANLRWAEFLMERTGEEIGPAEYTSVAEEGLFDGLGDWVFWTSRWWSGCAATPRSSSTSS